MWGAGEPRGTYVEDTPLPLAGVGLAAWLPAGQLLNASLSAAAGTLTLLPDGAAPALARAGSGTARLALAGTAAELNATLRGGAVVYAQAQDQYAGACARAGIVV